MGASTGIGIRGAHGRRGRVPSLTGKDRHGLFRVLDQERPDVTLHGKPHRELLEEGHRRLVVIETVPGDEVTQRGDDELAEVVIGQGWVERLGQGRRDDLPGRDEIIRKLVGEQIREQGDPLLQLEVRHPVHRTPHEAVSVE